MGSEMCIRDSFKTIDDISAEARRVRLDLDKLVTKRKAEVKENIILSGKSAYERHIADLKNETGGPWIALPAPDFVGAAKGKRSVASIQDAVDTVLANAKIEADASAKRISANLTCIKEDGDGYEFLFADKLALIGKPINDLRLVIKTRITEHKAAEEKRLEEERERIRREEQQKLQNEAAAKTTAPAASPSPQSSPIRKTTVAPVTQIARAPRPSSRPSDAEIINALVSFFESTEAEVIGWLCELDFSPFDHAA